MTIFESLNQSGEMLAMLNTICALPSLQEAAWHYSLLAAKNGLGAQSLT